MIMQIVRRVTTGLALLLAIASMPFSYAQELKKVTIEEATPGSREYWKIVPQSLPVVGVAPSGVLLHLQEGIYAQGLDIKTRLLKWEHVGGRGNFTPFSERVLAGWVDNDYVLYDYLDSKVVARYSVDRDKWSTQAVAPNGSYMMLSDRKNIAVMVPGGTPYQLTQDGSFDVTYGIEVHRSEFGISGGLFISPDSRYVAFYRNDQSDVEPYPIVRVNSHIAVHDPIKYPMAGRKSERVTIGIYDTQAGTIQYLETGAPYDRFFTNIAWAPDSRSLLIDEVERSQQVTHLREYDVTSGRLLRTLIEERNPKYIEPREPIHFLSDGRFVRLSRVDGYSHFYLYSREGKLLRQITRGAWEVKELLGIDEHAGKIYFTSNKDYIIGQDLYSVNLEGGASVRLTEGEGWHSVTMSDDYKLFLDNFSNLNTPGVSTLVSLESGEKKEILRAEDPLVAYEKPVVELGSLKSDSGDDLYYKLTRPATLEAGKKYPVVLYVYGGPHSQLVNDSWRGLRMGWDTYMASQGYVVFTLDNRGTAHRGMGFESITHRQLGTVEMADQMKGIEYLKGLPYVDSDRIGVYGWSFGGFMTTNLILTYPETFKVGVAGGPVMDWSYYEVMYGERYMDTPEENPEGYAKNNLIKRAGDLKGRLLLIHGGVDPVVLWQHSQLFLQAAVKAVTLPDYMVYPMDEHNVRGQDRVHLHKVICRYFEDHL
ncbi:DPP IV N-terminal domain-containing protein [Porphyromonas levii]|uniref:S9 family peptidase n=1 Tax=Porphyromonas levii TaxID=28114 RepID=UPI001BAA6238